jgi:hypothetical protein
MQVQYETVNQVPKTSEPHMAKVTLAARAITRASRRIAEQMPHDDLVSLSEAQEKYEEAVRALEALKHAAADRVLNIMLANGS